MKKQFIYIILLLALGAWYACNKKESVIDPQQQMLEAVDALLNTGGDLSITAVEKNETTILSSDTLASILYDDPNRGGYAAYPVKTVTRHSVTSNPMEFVTLDPWGMLWPGALVQGASLRNGVPAVIPIYSKRLPGRISLNVVSGNEDMDGWYKEVPMRGSDVTQAMNELLGRYLGGGFPARTSFEIKSVSSVEELASKLGINLSLFGAKLKSEFGNSWNKEKNYVAVKLNQLFFTMRYDGPDGGFSGTFTNDITTNDLKNYTGPGNPICYVSAVSYGRSFILLYESEKSAQELEFALHAAYKTAASITIDNRAREIINSSSCKLVQIGGDPQAGLETVFGDFSKIRDFVINGATVSTTNVGAPISYEIMHLHNNTLAQLSNTLEYEVTTTEYLDVIPMNNMVIDIFNIEMAPPTYNNGKKASVFSNMTMKELWVSHGPVDNVTSYKFDENFAERLNFDKSTQMTHSGLTMPIYNTYVFALGTNNPNDHRIRIYCKFHIDNQTFVEAIFQMLGGARDIILVQDFEYDGNINKWQPITGEETAISHSPFNALRWKQEIGSVTTEFTLNYRFVCDGRIYTSSDAPK